MSKPLSKSAFRPEVPGTAYYTPEKAPVAPPVPALTALEQMFGYYD